MKGWFLRLQATGKFVLNPRHRVLQTFPRAQDPPLSASQNPFLPEIFRILEMLFCRISPGRPAEISVDKVNSYCNSWHIAGDRRTMSAQYGALSPDCAALPRVEPRAQPTKGRKVQVQVQVQTGCCSEKLGNCLPKLVSKCNFPLVILTRHVKTKHKSKRERASAPDLCCVCPRFATRAHGKVISHFQ